MGKRDSDAWIRLAAVSIVAVAVAVAVLAWTRQPDPPAAAPTAARSPALVAVTTLSPTDTAFLQLMISLDSSALPLLGLLAGSADATLAPLGTTCGDRHRAELSTLRAALKAGGVVEDGSIHAGHRLPGMVIDTDLAAVRALPAAQQAARAVALLRDHLAGTTNLARSEGQAGSDPATKAAAAAILQTHQQVLAGLPAM